MKTGNAKSRIKCDTRIEGSKAVIRIRMFLGLLDPDPELFCKYPAPAPDPSIKNKNFYKNRDFCCLVTSE